MSCGERTRAGMFLVEFITKDLLGKCPLLKKGEYYASIHNGGQHTFVLTLEKRVDFIAFLEALEDGYANIDGYDDFMSIVRTKVQ